MFILGIVGSPRKNGRTNELVEAALKGAKLKGATVKKIYLVDYEIKQYIGQDGSPEAYTYCPKELSKLCEDADAIVLGAPVYWGDINGLTKDFMDIVRISNSSEKLALGIAIAGGTGKGLLSGIQSIYHFFYHKQMKGIDPTPVSRFNFQEVLEQLKASGSKLVNISKNIKPFIGKTADERWPEVLAYYTSIKYFNCDPLDEFVMLAKQLIRLSDGNEAEKAKTKLDEALKLIAEGKRNEAAECAVNSYQILFFPP